MRIVVQRVNRAKVTSNGIITGEIQKGIMVLVGLGVKDVAQSKLVEKWAKKVLRIRLWDEILAHNTPQITAEISENAMEPSEEDKTSVPQQGAKKPRNWCSNVMENGYGVLVVSQFTLFGKLKGNKPDFHDAMNGEDALALFNHFVESMRADYIPERI